MVFVSVLTSNIAAFVSGICLTWTSPELIAFSNESTFDHELSTDEKSWISSFSPLGAAVGPFLFGYLADQIGRKYAILSLSVPFFISSMMLAFSHVVVLFYIARLLCGIAVGGLFTVLPMYIGEISNDKYRTVLASLMNVFICLGLLFSYVVGPFVSVTTFNIIIGVFPVLSAILFFIFGTESSHYHVSKNKISMARSVLHKTRGDAAVADLELKQIQEKTEREGSGSAIDIFRSKKLRKALTITVGLVVFQQFSGINAVLFYAQTIFSKANVPLSSVVCSILVGSVQFLSSFVAPSVANIFGRKTLLMFSVIGMAVFEIPLGVYCYLLDKGTDVSSISWVPILCLLSYIFVFNSAMGPLPWTILAEMFPGNVKASASMITASSCWFIGFLITKYFQTISDAIGMGASFWIFAGACVISTFFIHFYVLETKGKSLQDIQDLLE